MYTKRIFLYSSLLMCMGLAPGETSNHRDIILPYNESVERCHKKGQDWKRIQPLVTQELALDGITATITKVIQVICIVTEIEVEEPVVSVQVNWSAPQFRENGDTLAASEVSYEIYVYDTMGIFEMFTAEGTEWVNDFEPGTYQISMLAVDTDGLRSDMTEAVEAVITI